MVLLRYLTLLSMCHLFSFTSSSAQGKDNPIADALSHFQFQQLATLADTQPTAVPLALLAVLQVVSPRGVSFTCSISLATRHVYLSAQHRYFDFGRKDGLRCRLASKH